MGSRGRVVGTASGTPGRGGLARAQMEAPTSAALIGHPFAGFRDPERVPQGRGTGPASRGPAHRRSRSSYLHNAVILPMP